MTKILRGLFFAAIVLPLAASAVSPKETTPPRLKIPAGVEITVKKYLEESDAFELGINRAKDEGPNWATPEDLKVAVGLEGSDQDFLKHQKRDMGSVYVLKTALPLLWETEIKKRSRKAK